MTKIKYGLPYMGTKKTISDKILFKILSDNPNCKYFYDIFGGGGGITFNLINIKPDIKIYYNDYDKSQVDLIKLLIDNIQNNEINDLGILPEYYYNFIDNELFYNLKETNSAYGNFSRVIYSFSNNMKGYLYSKKSIEEKKIFHNFILFKCEKSKEFIENKYNINLNDVVALKSYKERRLLLWKKTSSISKDSFNFKFQHIQSMEKFELLKDLKFNNIIISNKSYEDIVIDTPINETIIYCDPPYRNTQNYKGIYFDYKKFDIWFSNLKYKCYLSEYNSPHKLIDSYKKKNLASGNGSRGYLTENLYINKKD